MKHIPLKIVPRVFYWALTFALLFGVSQTAYAFEAEPTLWVQVPQWSDDWEKCAVDVPDAACHWYVASADNTFGEGFDWESAPWYSIEGLKDVAPIQKKTVVEKLQDIG
tara:strand:- start:1205 stop:1531 length:327 start_codon:yes stop_codon:yes gene_type:complete